MFGMSGTELILVLIVALVVLGPEKLPGIARTIGKVMREFRKASREIQATLQVEEVRRTIRKRVEEEKASILENIDLAPDGDPQRQAKSGIGALQKKQVAVPAVADSDDQDIGRDGGERPAQGPSDDSPEPAEREDRAQGSRPADGRAAEGDSTVRKTPPKPSAPVEGGEITRRRRIQDAKLDAYLSRPRGATGEAEEDGGGGEEPGDRGSSGNPVGDRNRDGDGSPE